MTSPDSALRLTRIVTVHRQWGDVARWIDDARLADPRVEWIFVDDAEDAPCPPALRETAVGRGARFVADGVNRGRSGARNRGAALAAAPWLAHMDGDDLPLPLPPGFAFPEEAALLLLPFLAPGGASSWTESRVDTAVFDELFAALGGPAPFDWRPASLVWRREAFAAAAGYDGRFEGAEDAHLVWKALRGGVRTAKGEAPLVAVAEGGPRSGQLHLSSGRLRFWEAVEAAGEREKNPAAAHAGWRAREVQLRVVFWTARWEMANFCGRKTILAEGVKTFWAALWGRG